MGGMSSDWCYEGGCTYMTDTDTLKEDELHFEELESLYSEECIGMHD